MPTILPSFQLFDHNTFHVRALTDYYTEPASVEELTNALSYAAERELEILILGEGSNLLFVNHYPGLIIHPTIKGMECVHESGSEVLVSAGGGENWDRFVAFCVERGWYGPENLSLIPGSVGAAPVQNIGAYGREVGELVDAVEVMDRESGKTLLLSPGECAFGYRDSIFKHAEETRYIVTRVLFKLLKKGSLLLDYGRVRSVFEQQSEQTLASLRQTIIEIRQSKLPEYEENGNAGSFFKNPVISEARFRNLQEDFPEVPGYQVDGKKRKIPAAWLIEQCGWKGFREGDVGTWPHQPLVIVNYGQATGKEIFIFSEKIRSSVFEKFGISLEREVTVI